MQLSFAGANKFATLGEVLLWAGGTTLNVTGNQCSHLCCNPLCKIPAHVVVESAQKNNQRKGCRGGLALLALLKGLPDVPSRAVLYKICGRVLLLGGLPC